MTECHPRQLGYLSALPGKWCGPRNQGLLLVLIHACHGDTISGKG